MKTRLLLFTNANDKSLSLFQSSRVLEQYEVTILLLEQPLSEIENFLADQKATLVYVRDPFTIDASTHDVETKMELFFEWQNKQAGLVLIDGTTSFDQLKQYEDKWQQYQVYKDFMSHSMLYSPTQTPVWDQYLLKKRLSSRSKGIYFTQTTLDEQSITPTADEFLWQQKLEIKEEYRIYSIHGQIYPLACLRNPKKLNQRARISGQKIVPPTIFEFVTQINDKQKQEYALDFIGYDIAETTQGELYLLEQNKSPQVTAFFRETGYNLLEELLIGKY